MDAILEWYQLITSIIGTFALIASVTPTKKDDTIVSYLTGLIDFLGANFLNAKNAETE